MNSEPLTPKQISTPSEDEINRIYEAIKHDRINKTARTKEALSKIAGYR